MKVLVIGGNGFVGRHLAQACIADGHRVVRGVRHPSAGDIGCDLVRDTDASRWAPRLDGFDAVAFCAGLLRAAPRDLDAVHCLAPAAIAAACAKKRIAFLHVSMLGLDGAADTPYFRSKRAGEAAVRAANAAAIVVRPSLVHGADSPASRAMLAQSRLPVLLVPAASGLVAPVHVDDLAELCALLLGTLRSRGCVVDCVGREDMAIAGYLQALRSARHQRAARVLRVPNRWLRFAFDAAASAGARMLVPEALDLLEHGHTGNRDHFSRWMRRLPRSVSRFQAPRAPLAAQAGAPSGIAGAR